jgi:hypothetical protein
MRARKGRRENEDKLRDSMQTGDGRSDQCSQAPQAKEVGQRQENKCWEHGVRNIEADAGVVPSAGEDAAADAGKGAGAETGGEAGRGVRVGVGAGTGSDRGSSRCRGRGGATGIEPETAIQ